MIPILLASKAFETFESDPTVVEEKSQKSNFQIFSNYMDIMNLWIIFLVALFYALKCGGKYFDVIMACCCSPCYIAYRLAVPCN